MTVGSPTLTGSHVLNVISIKIHRYMYIQERRQFVVGVEACSKVTSVSTAF